MSAHLDIPFSPFALHFFCGSGGMAYGFQKAGFRGAGIDYDPRACDDYRRLTGEPAHCLNLATSAARGYGGRHGPALGVA